MRILLIDGDELLWRVACVVADETAAGTELARRADRLKAAFCADRLIFALSDARNWRKALWPGYKAHRAARPRPALLAPARRRLTERFETRSAPGLEADDVLGLAATDPRPPATGARPPATDPRPPAPSPGGALAEKLAALRAERFGPCGGGGGGSDQRIIVSRDKDLLTVPGLHGALSASGEGRLTRVSEPQADRAHLRLALAGDPTDGYRGCPGVGAVRAERILETAEPGPAGAWRAVLKAYERAGLGEEEALLQARLARVLRRGEIDARGRPRLWTPPGG